MSTSNRFLSVLATATTALCTLGNPINAQAEGLELGRLLTESPVYAALHTGTRTQGLSVSVGTFVILETDLYQVKPRDGQPGGQGVSIGVGYGLLGLPRYARGGKAAAEMEPIVGIGMTVAHEIGSAEQALGTAVGLKVMAGATHVAGTSLSLSAHAAALKGSGGRSAGEVGIAAGLIFD